MSTDLPGPSIELDAYVCPHCAAHSQQPTHPAPGQVGQHFTFRRCGVCQGWTIFKGGGALVYPGKYVGPPVHPDMPEDLAPTYEEAREIASRSPRGAAALLRLVIQELVGHLGEEKRQLDRAIGNLVKSGQISAQVQQALDIVRVTGNNAVHPGEIKFSDDPEAATRLFALVNMIVDSAIAQPARLQAMFDGLPEGAREAVARRDGAVAETPE